MTRTLASLLLTSFLAAAPAGASAQVVKVVADPSGQKLQVDGKDLMLLGMNWDYFPIGTNYAWSLWEQPDDVVKTALDKECALLKAMGVNTIRVYAGMPPRWVRYVYERWGIYTVINHTLARYGYTLDGVWIPAVNYADPRLRAAVTAEVTKLVESFKGTPGVLMWLLGNENNYGLSWSSFEIEALPVGERDAARAKHLYSLVGEVARKVKALDPDRPVAWANGDLQYIDLIASEAKGIDVMGANVYRGRSARDLFQVVKEKLGIPVMFTEFGADAYDAKAGREDDVVQASYLVDQWKEIYEQSAGKGKVGNAIGGMIFQWSDGWWKTGQESNLDVHDTTASWPNAGYPEDFVEGRNNMNEEWWGICAKGPPDARGLFDVYPRTAYYALQQAFKLDPYAAGTTPDAIARTFGAIDLVTLARNYRADKAAMAAAVIDKVRVSQLALKLETYSTGGHALDPTARRPGGFDHMESFFAGFQVAPASGVNGMLMLNVLGNVAANPIDEIYYEKHGRRAEVTRPDGTKASFEPDRLKVYRASVSWEEAAFKADAFYRTGHYHWGYEGDLFGLYREANYGPNIDTYDADAPLGVEVAFHQKLEGLKVAFGPQLWWGANPAIMAKYRRTLGGITLTLQHEEQLAKGNAATGAAGQAPERQQRKTALVAEWKRGGFGLQAGGLVAGRVKIGDAFVVAEGSPGSYTLRNDKVLGTDTFGAKLKATWETGRWHAYASGAYMGLVADGRPDPTITFTGWSLKDSGSGNQANALAGVAVQLGDFQVSPNFLWQKPLVGPVPSDAGPPRNVVDDPFAVRGNRETIAGELVVTWDPTPGTWLWQWDNDLREDAPLAASLDLVYRHQPTTRDAGLGFLADGVTQFAFPGAPPAFNVWEAKARVVGRPSANVRLATILYGGLGEANGDNARIVHRWGVEGRASYKQALFQGAVRLNDWGPYDYHRDFNLTFPLQLTGDLSYAVSTPEKLWLGFDQTRIGISGKLRYTDRNSPRFKARESDPLKWGDEYEIRTYIIVGL